MKPLFLSSLGSGLMTLGLVAGLTAPSFAGPILQPDLSVPANAAAPQITPVRAEWAGGNDRQMYNWRWRRHGVRQWHGDDWRWRHNNFREHHFSRNWDNGNWNDDWRWRRHHHRRYYGGGYYGGYHDNDNGAAALLGLGLGFGLGSLYQGYYNRGYYNNGYYAPRRYYRTLSSAHVRWCYNRYRSYRAADNTFQPYYGPRQQCISPYS
ncbi:MULTISPECIES: BA14K family protein [unclassified Mesorhizobium]|uniref:BA14K family protein n=1 Tax=unclassified Mesorhizobium TaxID=325217 RepID=UPI000FD88A81|nr:MULTISPECIES: BA14K family protein [unclassified Mesorhizobium]TGQ42734.1 BA14K family protein [Mesorhizobium sp. M00.F.Ca.ET.216.01.1.1]TIS54015.1 MAG: BA14K family protein [Mesorhizobium sp.]TIS86301.1 MAG: BA14K family protein [Mesorhizobium sp.]TJW14575.1 MAG: BA14K family protein [Mesorhizobium sp.]TJW44993.1 MAG: BA14K family protein [Mesorhizobium sp.]